MWVYFNVRDNRRWSFHWRKRFYGLWSWILARSKVLKIKVLMMDLFITNMQLLASQDVNWWSGVVWITCGLLWCFYQLFGLSFWRHPFTAEHPLVRQWCEATFLQIWWSNKLIYILNGLRVIIFFLANFHFCMNYSFNPHLFLLDSNEILQQLSGE